MSAALMALIAQRKAQTSRLKTLAPAAGRNRYRILPSWRNIAKAPSHLSDEEKGLWASQFYIDFAQHFLKDATGAIKAVALCTDKTYGRPCSICDEVARGIVNSEDDLSKARMEEAKSGGKVLMNVLHLDGPTPNQVQVLALSPGTFNGKKSVGGVVSLFTDWPSLVAFGGNAQGCADIIVDKSGTGKEGTVYNVSAIPTSITLDPSVMANIIDLDTFVAAEDNSASAARALAAVSSITGLLPAPQRPSLTAAAAAAFAPPAVAVAPVVFDDVPDFPTAAAQPVTVAVQTVVTPAPAPAPVVAPVAAAPVAAAVTADQSLEDLLKDL